MKADDRRLMDQLLTLHSQIRALSGDHMMSPPPTPPNCLKPYKMHKDNMLRMPSSLEISSSSFEEPDYCNDSEAREWYHCDEHESTDFSTSPNQNNVTALTNRQAQKYSLDNDQNVECNSSYSLTSRSSLKSFPDEVATRSFGRFLSDSASCETPQGDPSSIRYALLSSLSSNSVGEGHSLHKAPSPCSDGLRAEEVGSTSQAPPPPPCPAHLRAEMINSLLQEQQLQRGPDGEVQDGSNLVTVL